MTTQQHAKENPEDLNLAVDFKGERLPTLVSSTVVETDFAELADGSMVELIEDPGDTSRTLLAVSKDGEVRFTHRFQGTGMSSNMCGCLAASKNMSPYARYCGKPSRFFLDVWISTKEIDFSLHASS